MWKGFGVSKGYEDLVDVQIPAVNRLQHWVMQHCFDSSKVHMLLYDLCDTLYKAESLLCSFFGLSLSMHTYCATFLWSDLCCEKQIYLNKIKWSSSSLFCYSSKLKLTKGIFSISCCFVTLPGHYVLIWLTFCRIRSWRSLTLWVLGPVPSNL